MGDAQQPAEMRDGLEERSAAGGGAVACGDVDSAGVRALHRLIAVRADPIEVDGGAADRAQLLLSGQGQPLLRTRRGRIAAAAPDRRYG